MQKTSGIIAALVCVVLQAVAAEPPGRVIHNEVVYREAGRYGGWPANHGIWIWANEILVGFEAGYFKYNDHTHSIDWDRPAEHLLARSMDGGETWNIEHPLSLRAPDGLKQANVPTEPGGKQPVDCPGGIDFTNPNFVLTARMADVNAGPSRFYYSYDRGRTWRGPFRMPDFGQKGIAARTDYFVNGPHDLTMFLTAAKSNGKEGRVICVRTRDGGKTWTMLSFVGPEPPDSDMAIMPSSVHLSNNVYLTAIRHTSWIELYRSDDAGLTWRFVCKPVAYTGEHHGNPPFLVKLKDGRIALTYGFRAEPFGIRARLSSDEGQTWSVEIPLRTDGGTWDLGYTRTVQRPDGKLVTVYYFNDHKDTERYIGATIWEAK
ncbi:MAG TPA: sialidase family protein [Bryobacteraceae bacterium]|nr:sialidase family protein [Bryobacteraceae bacterium]